MRQRHDVRKEWASHVSGLARVLSFTPRDAGGFSRVWSKRVTDRF